MALIDAFKKKYRANVWCNNCNTHSEVNVPRGVTVVQFIESGACPNCGCAALVADYRQIDEFKEKTPKPKIQLLRPRMVPRPPVEPKVRAPVPDPRPSTRSKRYRPLPESQAPPNFEPRKIFKEDPVDFWTGNPRSVNGDTQNEGPGYQDDGGYEDENY
jgi:hypothetical protein